MDAMRSCGRLIADRLTSSVAGAVVITASGCRPIMDGASITTPTLAVVEGVATAEQRDHEDNEMFGGPPPPL